MRSSGGAPIRLGLVGCGRLAEAGYAPALAALEDIELVAVADTEAGRARDLAALAGRAGATPSVHESAEDLLAAIPVDAVVVATPADRHLDDAETVAASGAHCLVEKPPAADAAGAAALAGLQPMPWIGFNRRFAQGRDLISRLPADGELDLELEINYRRASWRPHGDPGDALADLGPHLVDLALVLTGSPGAEVVAGELGPRRAEIELETPRGSARLRCTTDRPHRESVMARRPGGRRLASWRQGGLAAGIEARIRRRESPLISSLGRQLEALAGALADGEPGLLATADDGSRAMQVLDEARRLAGRKEAA